MTTKFCPSCSATKPMSDFSRSANRYDLHDWQCRACANKARRIYRQRQDVRDSERIYQRQYYKEHRQQSIARVRRYQQTEKGKAASKRYRARNSEKRKAQVAVMNAVATDKLPHISTHTCSDCETTAADHYHHESYSPECALDVIPLCQICHIKRHNSPT